jgi:hypothetical protein
MLFFALVLFRWSSGMPYEEPHLTNRVVSFRVPYLTRRVAQSTWEFSASGCSSSAVACVLCKPLGRVSLDAHVDEQRREKAEARVPFLLVSFLWARKEKTLAYRRKKMLNQRAELSQIEHHSLARSAQFVQSQKSNSPRGEIKCRKRAPNHQHSTIQRNIY